MLRGSKSVTNPRKPFVQYEDGSTGRRAYPSAPAGRRAMVSKGFPQPMQPKPLRPDQPYQTQRFNQKT